MMRPTRAALCATAGGGLGRLRVRALRGPGRGTRRPALEPGRVVAEALRVKSGHLRLAPLFTLLNHGEDRLRPTELEDSPESGCGPRLAAGGGVRINYGHGVPRPGAGVLHRYGWFPSTAPTEFVSLTKASDGEILESLRRRWRWTRGVAFCDRACRSQRGAGLRRCCRSSAPTALCRCQDASTAARTATTQSASSSCGLFGLFAVLRVLSRIGAGLFAAETDRDVAYGWLLRRSPQLLARGRAHCCAPCSMLPSPRREGTPRRRLPAAARQSSPSKLRARYRQGGRARARGRFKSGGSATIREHRTHARFDPSGILSPGLFLLLLGVPVRS